MHLPASLGTLGSSLVLGLALTLALGACGPKFGPDGLPTGGPEAGAPLRIGMEAQYPPFESTAADGTIVGFDVDLVRAFGASLGRKVELSNLAFDALIPELQAGRVDAVCSGMSFTAERAKTVDFSRPYLRTVMGVLVSREKAADVKRIADLDAPGVVIAVQRGTTGETKAKEAFPKAAVQQFENEVDAASQVDSGRAHAFVYDMASVRKLAAKSPDRVRILDGDLGTEDYCMAFAKGSPLVARANAFLETASAPGGAVDGLIATWKPTAERVPPGGK